MTTSLVPAATTALVAPEGETQAMAVAAQAKATIEARWIVAKGQPRNIEIVRQELLRECQRPSFAAAARYRKPIGQGIEGLSIRFVEATLQCMGNVDVESITIFDTELKRIVEVRVTDFQKNICHRKQITIDKTVERRNLRAGQVPIATRTNSTGQKLYIVKASEDDLLNKEGALVSKAIRTCGLRIIPGWLQDEATEIIVKTVADQAARDPDAEQRKLTDAFGGIGVTPKDLEEYMAHPMAQIVPAELVDLRAVYQTIMSGEATWVDTLQHRQELRGDAVRESTAATTAAKPQTSSGTSKVKDLIAKKTATTTAKPAMSKTLNVKEETTVAPETLDNATSPTQEQPNPKVAEEKGVAPGAKRPSRSKAAQDERKIELKGLGLKPGKYATLYIQHGDPRNKAKALAALEEEQEAEMAAAGEAVEQSRELTTTTDGTVYDSGTGEVMPEEKTDPEEEPAWMSVSTATPPGEGF